MERELVRLDEAVSIWAVSEEQLRRRLAGGDAPDAERTDDDSWMIPRGWLDEEFERLAIDLRDPQVSEGLAAVLAQLTDLTKQVTEAEVRAAVAETERDGLQTRLRLANDTLEQRTADFERSLEDVNRLEQELAVVQDRLYRSEEDREQAWQAWRETEDAAEASRAEAQALIDQLSGQLDAQHRRNRLLESVIGRRQRRRIDRLAGSEDS